MACRSGQRRELACASHEAAIVIVGAAKWLFIPICAVPVCRARMTLKARKPNDYSEVPQSSGRHLKKRRRELRLPVYREGAERMALSCSQTPPRHVLAGRLLTGQTKERPRGGGQRRRLTSVNHMARPGWRVFNQR